MAGERDGVRRVKARPFESFVLPEPMSGCWLWTGCTNEHGYGTLHSGGRTLLAHRRAWAIATGSEPPAGLGVLHKCDVRPCVNPSHLYVGTQRENAADCVRRGRMPDRRGEKHPRAFLAADDVIEIRRMYAAGVSQVVAAERFGITRGHVHSIVKRRIWANL